MPAVLALLGGQVDAVAVSLGEVATHVQSGKLRTLVVMADKRLRLSTGYIYADAETVRAHMWRDNELFKTLVNKPGSRPENRHGDGVAGGAPPPFKRRQCGAQPSGRR